MEDQRSVRDFIIVLAFSVGIAGVLMLAALVLMGLQWRDIYDLLGLFVLAVGLLFTFPILVLGIGIFGILAWMGLRHMGWISQWTSGLFGGAHRAGLQHPLLLVRSARHVHHTRLDNYHDITLKQAE